MKVINLFGGPGAGKSTSAALLFFRMKERGMSVELVTEYAKQLTWDERYNTLSDQIYVFAKQQRALTRLRGKVDFVVTDAPLFNSIVYKTPDFSNTFDALILEEFAKYENINIFINSSVKYDSQGRTQTQEEANSIAALVKTYLKAHKQRYLETNTIDFKFIIEELIRDYC